jgi:hypothetical protein
MPVVSEAIDALVAKFDDTDSDVCKAAVNGFIDLAKHSKSNLCQFNQ